MQDLKKRAKELINKMLSLTFLTWLAVFVTLIINKEFKGFDAQFYLFTAGIIGLKQYFKQEQNK